MLFESCVLPEIKSLDPVTDNQRIVLLSCRCDFPFDTTRALEFALFRTFSVPSIGAQLDRTREFGDRTQKRYDDTDAIICEIMEHGYESERGARAIARMNAIHGRFQISNADYLYVLSTFVFEPIRWNRRFGWRQLCKNEQLGMFYFWKAVGERMNIREIPETYGTFETYNREYEAKHFRPHPGSARVAEATMRLFAGWAPTPLRGMVKPAMTALMDAPLRNALNLPAPRRTVTKLLEAALRLRGRLAEGILTRSSPTYRSGGKLPSYPDGYTIEQLGPARPDSAA